MVKITLLHIFKNGIPLLTFSLKFFSPVSVKLQIPTAIFRKKSFCAINITGRMGRNRATANDIVFPVKTQSETK